MTHNHEQDSGLTFYSLFVLKNDTGTDSFLMLRVILFYIFLKCYAPTLSLSF